MTGASDRLDSWKAIAEYLGRDARTLRRWERLGLPVRRVAGSRGHSVFAFKSEIDLWLKTHADEVPSASSQPAAPAPAVAPLPQPVSAASPQPPPTWQTVPHRWRFAIATVVVIIAIVGWKAMAPAARQPLSVTVSPAAVIAKDAGGAEQWRYEFGPSLRNTASALGTNSTVINGPDPAVFVQSSTLIRQSDETTLNGVLRWFSLDGRVERSFSFDDQWSFVGHVYSQPWALTDFRVDDSFGRRRIALAAHHAMWWPSVVTVLDGRFQREGSFVNAGWVENVRWSSPDRLVVSGFNQRLNGGMVAILDTHDMNGASPEPAGSPFACDNCAGARPIAYVVLPRSEVNRVTGSPFNRAIVEVTPAGIVAHTFEMDPDQMKGLTEAIYEFSPTLELQRAEYGTRYWDRHHALELEGKITHTRDTCPERDGPPLIKMWTRAAGWTDVHPKR